MKNTLAYTIGALVREKHMLFNTTRAAKFLINNLSEVFLWVWRQCPALTSTNECSNVDIERTGLSCICSRVNIVHHLSCSVSSRPCLVVRCHSGVVTWVLEAGTQLCTQVGNNCRGNISACLSQVVWTFCHACHAGRELDMNHTRCLCCHQQLCLYQKVLLMLLSWKRFC